VKYGAVEAVDEMECKLRMMAHSRHCPLNGSAECTAEEMSSSRHSGNINYIFWVWPRDLTMWNTAGSSDPTGTPVVQSAALTVLCAWRAPVHSCFWMLRVWGASRLRVSV